MAMSPIPVLTADRLPLVHAGVRQLLSAFLVLALLAAGLSNQAIGARLHVSQATIKFHCSNSFAKLGVRTRSQAVAAAFANDLVPHLMPAVDPHRLSTPELPAGRLALRA